MSLGNKIRGLREVWAFDNRLSLILAKTFFRSENLQVYRYKGVEILVDHAGGDNNGTARCLPRLCTNVSSADDARCTCERA